MNGIEKDLHWHGGEHGGSWENPHIREVSHELTVQYATHPIRRVLDDGQVQVDLVNLRSYNGKLVGPVMEVRPGDTLKVLLKNQLPFKEDMVGDHPHNGPHGSNVTNLHFHGMHVSPAGNSDNVMLSIGPNQQFEYEVKIPGDHPAGTHWYHAHKHGAVGIQLGSGMAGPLIVRGGIDGIEGIREARERILVLQQIPYKMVTNPYDETQQANMVEEFAQLFEFTWLSELVPQGRRVTINGETLPTFQMRPGEVERWRFIHAGIHFPFRLRLVREGGNPATESIPYYLIAMDGITTGRLDKVDETEMHPGYREDVLVQAVGRDGKPLAQGTYLLVDEVEQNPQAKVLARIIVSGPPKKMKLPRPEMLARFAPFKPILDEELTSHTPQPAHFEVQMLQPPPTPVFKFLLNGIEFDAHAPPRLLTLGAVEEWLVTSTGVPEFFPGHPFHIHTNPFQFTDAQGRIVWKDTLFVPVGQQFRLRTRYKRYVGQFMLHCHIVSHEDEGMMELLEVVPPKQDAGGGGHGPHH
ncbi:multicopper oxidase family protein [Stigmatella erecta]|uniref:Multicopper oxidase with three cupredoxin domains (Includes cell division protein FtsP and spore coat protein CotA) n=1 Tax=Stigmatella erecta TaxID=83460 RepID=A0A1I0K5J5_9BACT|nr:multicopper oxidase family protein [Stigmatella erecta]SEU18105.1 Multicopper oxidase with three cupredoxin domains (includes cell division protein FtsP and spore coat protein CotA) [Stigmatella erecta]